MVYELTKEEAKQYEFDLDYSNKEWMLEGDTYNLHYCHEEKIFRLEKAGKKPYTFYVSDDVDLYNTIKILELMD